MTKLTAYITVGFSAILFILNYEFFYINAEGIFIISFLLFSLGFYYFAGDMIGSLLDSTSLEISQKIKEVSSLQKMTLAENKKLLDTLKETQAKMIKLFVFTIFLIEKREDLLEQLQKRSFRNFFEKKLKVVLIETSLLNSQLAQKAGKEIMDLYEKKIKK